MCHCSKTGKIDWEVIFLNLFGSRPCMITVVVLQCSGWCRSGLESCGLKSSGTAESVFKVVIDFFVEFLKVFTKQGNTTISLKSVFSS